MEFVLREMRETVFYAQESVGGSVICATPIPVPGADLNDMIDREIEQPTNPQQPEYQGNDHVAFALMNALKATGACKRAVPLTESVLMSQARPPKCAKVIWRFHKITADLRSIRMR